MTRLACDFNPAKYYSATVHVKRYYSKALIGYIYGAVNVTPVSSVFS